MTYEEIKAAVERLPRADQLRLVREISHTTDEHLESSADPPDDTSEDDEAWRKEFEVERARLLKDVSPDSWLHQILGIARTREKVPMTKEEDRQAILEYLTQKYGR